jgi:hypothetical protein
MSNALKIKIFIPYFGDLPKWSCLFFTTFAHNKCIDLHLIGNFDQPVDLPSNVSFTKMDLSSFKAMIEEKLGFEVSLPYPFKVCDFRPCFGQIFSDHLSGYDFWGWADTDIVFGDIISFLHRNAIDSYDIFTVRSDFISGEFTLLRNTPRVNQLYTLSRDWKKILKDERGFDFEELGFFGLKDATRRIESFTEVAYAAYIEQRIRLSMKDLGHNDRKTRREKLNLRWSHGRLWDIHTGLESMLYHFLDLKKQPDFFLPSSIPAGEKSFSIAGKGVSFLDFCGTVRQRKLASLIDCSTRHVRRYRAHYRLAGMISDDLRNHVRKALPKGVGD